MNGTPAPVGRRSRLSPFRLLLLLVLLFGAVTFALSWVRAAEFQTTTWDMGLYQQALWSTAHGRAFYETADVETGGYNSLLQVHAVFLFYLLAPLYGLLPSQLTLFAVQSAVVGAAAVPLFFLARDLTRSDRLALLAGGVYLGSAMVLSSILYDFHPEAFLPVELFALALLWHRRRYAAGFAVAAVAFSTLELAPVLIAFFALFALATSDEPGEPRRDLPVSERATSLRTRGLRWFAAARVQASLLLLVASVGAYALLLYVRVDLLIAALGTTPLPEPPTGYVIGATPASLGLSLSNLGVGFAAKATYWLLLLALLGFVPLLAPRALLLAVPWVGFTMLSGNLNYVTWGFQYGLVAAGSLQLAFVYGLPTARVAFRAVVAHAARAGPGPARTFLRGRLSRPGAVALAAVAVLVAANLALSPLNPAMQNSGLGSAYRLSYDVPPGGSEVQALVALLPTSATVVASDDLFPLVANDVNAYSFSWTADPTLGLPFSPADPPPFVLLAEDRTGAVPAWLVSALYDPGTYGVRGVVWSSAVGTVVLYEAGYTGTPEVIGPAASATASYYGGSIASSGAGTVATLPGSTYPTVVESAPGTTGTIWEGPGGVLPAGTYTVTLSLRAWTAAGFPAPPGATPVVWVGAYAFGETSFFSWYGSWGALGAGAWVTAEWNVTVPEPTFALNVQGVALDPGVVTCLNYVAVSADPPDPGPS